MSARIRAVRSRLSRGVLVAVVCGVILVPVGLLVGMRPVGDQQQRHHLTRSATGRSRASSRSTRCTPVSPWPGTTRAVAGTRRASIDTDADNWSVGDELDVRYDPAHTQVRPADELYTNDSALRVTARVQGAVLLAAGLLLVLVPLLRPRRARVYGCDPALTWPLLGAVAPAGAGQRWPSSLGASRCGDLEDADVRRRRAWRQYGRTAKRLLVGSVVTAAAATVLIFVVVRSDNQLLRQGLRTTGTVEGGGFGGRYTQDYVEVRYTDSAGHVRDGTLHGPSPDELRRGSRVTVIYDKGNPGRFRTSEYANNGNLPDSSTVVLPTASVMLALTGALTLGRWRRGLRVLADGHWLDVAVAGARRFPQRGSVLLALDAGPGRHPVVVRFTGSRRGAAAMSDLRGSRWLSVCVAPTQAFALADAHELTPPVFVALPRTDRQRDRWGARLLRHEDVPSVGSPTRSETPSESSC